ncbi:MAG: hypothetical protein JSV91_03085 [Phycisphaerales bacterium]|nr:MAG: hypothetical protein JSV91_03085 [Phycisphaerales bacterium]
MKTWKRSLGIGHSVALATGILLIASTARASVSAEVGLDDLIERIGAENVPTGIGVVVGQVEAGQVGAYGPNQGNPEFAGKTFIPMSGDPGAFYHATVVGKNYYGLVTSISPGIDTIHLYTVASGTTGWLTYDYLRTNFGSTVQPLPTPEGLKIFNNSWVGTFQNTSLDNQALRRADFVINRDDLLIVNGVNNGGTNYPLMSHMYNGLSVGIMSGGHTTGDTGAAYDGPGRQKPEIVSSGDPDDVTSFTTPVVSAACAMMVETARTEPPLAANPNAERSVVIKAVILGGARHRDGWTNNPDTTGPNRGVTDRPLDDIYGVDVVNVNRSHLILTGAEQDGAADVPASSNADWRGWDFANVDRYESRYWRFDVTDPADEVAVLATWHRYINNGDFVIQGASADFDLILWRVNEQNEIVTLVGDEGLPYFAGGNVVSQSDVNNLEHLYITGLEAGNYVLELRRQDDYNTDWDVAVTWLLPEPSCGYADVNCDGTVNIDDLFAVLAAWGACDACPEDINEDGVVNIDDIFEVLGNWG